MRSVHGRGFSLAIALGITSVLLEAEVPAQAEKLALRDGWMIQSSAVTSANAKVLSQPGFEPQGWHPASVPTTVLAALVKNGVYPDPYFGMNLRQIPGAGYETGTNFSKVPMPPDSPFRVSWWYRRVFRIPPGMAGKVLWLHLNGVNYRANVWLNGQQVAGADEVAGEFRLYEFEITRHVHARGPNCLAIEVFPPEPDSLAITWVDWNPAPPDKNLGLWQDVYISSSGPVTLRHPHVTTELDMPSLHSARLTVTAEVHNSRDRPLRGRLRGMIGTRIFSRLVELGPHEQRLVSFKPEQFPQLTFSHPRLWWPYQLGPQNLYELKLEFTIEGAISDRQAATFGIQQMTSELTDQGYRLFRVNGKRILVRGAGWAPDMLLRSSPERLETELRYVKEMNLNTVRLEGKMESEEFFRLADRYGILVMAGWCCCDHWEKWAQWNSADRKIAAASLSDQVPRLRNHPSVLVWLNASDDPPPAEIEQLYLDILQRYRWPKPVLSSATRQPSALSGATGVKMSGPYDWVPPSYWLADTRRGGAFGFNTETSPGAAIPPVESLKQMLPQEHLWPPDEFWSFHAGGGQFKDLKLFTAAMSARYGPARSLEDYVWKSQAMAYEGQRAMFEAYGRNKYSSTGIIQWMLNNAWPSTIWHLYDYFLRPAGGYYGTKKACEPLHVQYSYDDGSVVVVNQRPSAFPRMKVSAKVYDLELSEKFTQATVLDISPDSSTRALVIPEVGGPPSTYFVKLSLEDSSGKLVSSNFYWLSTKPDVLDWDKGEWYYTPVSSYGDLTALEKLTEVKLQLSSKFENRGAEGIARVTLENPTHTLAFLVRLKVTCGKGGQELLPTWWEDNYLTLVPGEKRNITAIYKIKGLGGTQPAVELDGWNVRRTTHQ